jgi:hypothetical protein
MMIRIALIKYEIFRAESEENSIDRKNSCPRPIGSICCHSVIVTLSQTISMVSDEYRWGYTANNAYTSCIGDISHITEILLIQILWH